MKLKFSYHLPYQHHYPGELYSRFYNYLKEKYNVEICYEDSYSLAQRFSCSTEYSSGFPSIFNVYNLILTNEENNKTFIHSLHDYAPASMENGSGIENFDVVKFACCSRLDQHTIDKFSTKYFVQPSFYMLENINDLDYLQQSIEIEKIYNKAYFNGLTYGIRGKFASVLNKSGFFDIRKRDGGDFLPKPSYYETLAKYKFGFNLDGVAKICYRDLECFGLKVLLLRENLDVITYDPILKNIHYADVITDEIKNKVFVPEHENYVIDYFETKINELINSGEYEFITNNARIWYENNCLPENQLKILDSFLDNLAIFE